MNSSTALARVLAAALPELGVRHVLLCPGSRSAPLAYALGAAEQAGLIRLYVRLDERSAGFVALGLAKASGQPVAIVTTSGTAVANLHPAVLEASHSGVPLLVISADRPHELRGTGANQTTDQTRLFGTATRYFAEIPAGPWPGAGSASATAGGWRNVLARTVAAATGALSGDPGPVQLNVAFHEPLTPGPDEPMDAWPAELTAVDGLTRVLAATTAGAVTLGAGPRTVVLAADGAGPAAARVAAAAGWPLLAEPSAGTGAAGIPAYRLLLAEPRLGGQIERVIVFGRPTLSRPVTRLLAREDVEVIVVSPRPVWTDAARRASMVLPALGPQDVPATSPDDDAWPTLWRSAGAAAAQVIDDLLEDEAAAGRLTGPLIAREVLAVTAVSDVLVVGSSNPIRDLDLIGGSGRPVLANRGLAGIDGIISTAAGVALACAGPGTVRALVGDLTFLHDAGGLAVGTLEQAPDLQIVVPDDSGGSIFETLEQGEQAAGDPGRRARFERLFATPQRTDLAAICAGYRVRHTLVKDLDGLRAALADPPAGLSVVQVPIERTSRRELAGRLAAVVEATIRDVRNPAR